MFLPNLPLSIQNACHSDAPILTQIAFAAKRHWQYPEEWIQLWKEDLTITEEFILQNPLFTATIGGKIVAFAALKLEEKQYELEHLWVLPDYMGLGIGKKLVLHLKQFLQSKNIDKLEVISDPNALGFYQKMGGTVIGEWESALQGRSLPILEIKMDLEFA